MRSCSYCGVVAVCSHLVYLDQLRSVSVAAGADEVVGRPLPARIGSSKGVDAPSASGHQFARPTKEQS